MKVLQDFCGNNDKILVIRHGMNFPYYEWSLIQFITLLPAIQHVLIVGQGPHFSFSWCTILLIKRELELKFGNLSKFQEIFSHNTLQNSTWNSENLRNSCKPRKLLICFSGDHWPLVIKSSKPFGNGKEIQPCIGMEVSLCTFAQLHSCLEKQTCGHAMRHRNGWWGHSVTKRDPLP